LPADSHGAGEVHRYFLPGPDGSKVIVEERELIVATPKGARPIRITAAMNYETVTEARSRFAYDMMPYIIVLGVFLLSASAVQLTLGLRPLKTVRDGLNAVRNHRKQRLDGKFPDELKPLTQAINRLLDSQDETIARARKRAADLAHGLNSPLTVLVNDAEKLKAKGEVEIADELSSLAKTMQSHIDYELTRSRITPEQGQRKSDGRPHQVASQIIKTLQRTPKGDLLDWKITVPKDISVPVDPDDLRELLGNITENALKWTESMIAITGIANGDELILTIEDDGKGLDPRLIETTIQRGIRHDQKTPGTGIGLSLVREICDINDIKLTIENRQSQGLCVTLVFKLASPA
jgi:signal transduction histidine kinase